MGNDDPWPWWQEDAQHLGVPMARTRRGMVWGWGWRWEWGQGQGTVSVSPQQCRELACIQVLPPASQVRCRPLCRAWNIQTPWGHPSRPLGRGGGGPPALPGPDTALPGALLGAGQGESCSSGSTSLPRHPQLRLTLVGARLQLSTSQFFCLKCLGK